MFAPVVFLGLALLIALALRIRLARRRRAERAMIVTTWPEIEFSQMYGGWDAEAYDAGTGHDRSPTPAPLYGGPGRCIWSRPPWRTG
jgi:hypothetical protein